MPQASSGRPTRKLQDAVERFRELNPEPWGLANGLEYAAKLGLSSRVISYNYGQIEGEPSFPLTNFGGAGAYEAGAHPGPRGVMGNAQTHCVQLPEYLRLCPRRGWQAADGCGVCAVRR